MGSKRKIIKIDQEKCTGCGECIPNCPEGALQIIDEKARLISDLFCDGLGACIGHCPEGAITIEERDAEPYDENKVMKNIVKQGPNTIAAHLKHLKEHGANEYYEQAVTFLKKKGIKLLKETSQTSKACACPGSRAMELETPKEAEVDSRGSRQKSYLRNWPIQITLVPVTAPYLKNADLLIAADCVGPVQPNFHEDLVKGKILLIGCPKLDDADFYLEKLTSIFRENSPKSVTCVHMTVPCCFGLSSLVQEAITASGKKINYQEITIGLQGETVGSKNKQ